MAAMSQAALTDGASATTTGAGSHGVFLQSVGGGGGDAGTGAEASLNANLALNLGAKDGSTGDGGTIRLTGRSDAVDQGPAEASISTGGDYAHGVLAQSIGGGGGTGGSGFAGADRVVTLGCTGSASGSGGDVSVSLSGDVTTGGVGAYGIAAQSVGGGGGGLSGKVDLTASAATWGFGRDMGADGTAAGDGGAVGVTLEAATVDTTGNSTLGIFVQSVGGGVLGSIDDAPTLVGNSGGTGAVSVSLTDSTVNTGTGSFSHGIFAQTSGGTGSETGPQVPVNITLVNSTVQASGAGSAGIVVQNAGSSRGAITIEIDDSSTVLSGLGGAPQSSASYMLGGRSTNVINNGDIIGSLRGNATEAAGTLQAAGPVLLTEEVDAPVITMVNREDGVFTTSGLSQFDELTNYGRIEAGLEGLAEPLLFTGDVFNMAGSTTALEFAILEQELARQDRIASGGSMFFELGATLSIEPFFDFTAELGSSFDLLLAEDLKFETENLLDYVMARSSMTACGS